MTHYNEELQTESFFSNSTPEEKAAQRAANIAAFNFGENKPISQNKMSLDNFAEQDYISDIRPAQIPAAEVEPLVAEEVEEPTQEISIEELRSLVDDLPQDKFDGNYIKSNKEILLAIDNYKTGNSIVSELLHNIDKDMTEQDWLQFDNQLQNLYSELGDNLPIMICVNKLSLTKEGLFKSTFINVSTAIICKQFCGFELSYDNFLGEMVIRDLKYKSPERFVDKHYGQLRFALNELGFQEVSQQTIKEAAAYACEQNQLDVAINWLEGLKWDGRPRVAGFMKNYFGCENSPYATAVSNYIWSALAGRILKPGCKADMVPTFKSIQGTAKSTALECMSPFPDYFTEIDLSASDIEIVRKMRGKCVLELAELKGLNTRSAEHIKSFISIKVDELRPLYSEFTKQFPRRSIFFGTTNEDEFLSDSTGNRRHLPIEIGKADIEAIKRDKLQLWAEGAQMFKMAGISWQDAERLAGAELSDYEITDVWEEPVNRWLMNTATKDITTSAILSDALSIEPKNQNLQFSRRIGNIMRALKYEQKRIPTGNRLRVWVKNSQPKLH